MTNGVNAERLRRLGGITREELAAAAGIGRDTIQRAEKNDPRVTDATFSTLFEELADAGLTLGRQAGVYKVDDDKLRAWKAALEERRSA